MNNKLPIFITLINNEIYFKGTTKLILFYPEINYFTPKFIRVLFSYIHAYIHSYNHYQTLICINIYDLILKLQ
jgi:hypothetical protein